MTKNELWEWLLEHKIATESELGLATALNGYTIETLESVLYVRTGLEDVKLFHIVNNMKRSNKGDDMKKLIGVDVNDIIKLSYDAVNAMEMDGLQTGDLEVYEDSQDVRRILTSFYKAVYGAEPKNNIVKKLRNILLSGYTGMVLDKETMQQLEQLDENLIAAEVSDKLNDDILEEIEQIMENAPE